MKSHSLTGPLILIAAAIFWHGSGAFHAGGNRGYDSLAGAGSIAAAILFLLGFFACAASRDHDK
jgi:hypothetical protein